ncbi:MAG TPA: tetratricopeptide repeat protein [Polyangiaceae bacterium]|nr:tetratricopeptide repeat protein [Polyangiaceae bacterium]
MSQDSVPPAEGAITPEDFLRRAMTARSPAGRARYARRGLATTAPLDRTTHAMLLRQLYLSHFETRRFRKAHEIALQAIELDVLTDVLHQDAARAVLATGDLERAILHLRAATRRGPASRRPFHLWTLGSILFLAQRYDEAISSLTRAARWGTREKPLYRAHLVLARIANGEQVLDISDAMLELARAPCGQGYGRFVLGHLAYAAGEWPAARRYLEAFVKRTETGGVARSIALEPEIRMARATIGKMSSN